MGRSKKSKICKITVNNWLSTEDSISHITDPTVVTSQPILPDGGVNFADLSHFAHPFVVVRMNDSDPERHGPHLLPDALQD
jgi:hypothetical protein